MSDTTRFVATLLFIVIAPWVIPPITGDKFSAELDQLTVGLSRVMFPIVVLLGLNGLVVGILNAYDHFAIPAIAPVVWNFVIIATLVLLKPLFEPRPVRTHGLGNTSLRTGPIPCVHRLAPRQAEEERKGQAICWPPAKPPNGLEPLTPPYHSVQTGACLRSSDEAAAARWAGASHGSVSRRQPPHTDRSPGVTPPPPPCASSS